MFSHRFRLRHEIEKPKPMDRGGPSEYQMLKTWELEKTKPLQQPKTIQRNKDDVFAFLPTDM